MEKFEQQTEEFPPPKGFWDHFDIAMVRDRPGFLYVSEGSEGRKVQLGYGHKVIKGGGWHNIDYPDWDAEDTVSGRWRLPYGNGEVTEIACYHTLDHLEPWAVVRAVSEFQRVLEPGGVATIILPHYSSQLANECIMHKSRFAIDTWRNMFSERQYSHSADRVGDTEWRFRVGLNVLIGLTERNLVQFTQLIKEGSD